MAVTRDLWIVLRARDEASRIVRSFGANVAGSAAAAAAGMSNFDRTMANVATRLNQFAMTAQLTGTVMAGFGVAGLAFIKSAADVAAEYDRQVRATMTQIDGITTSLEEVADVGRRVAKQVGIPFEQMQSTLFFIFSSMNVSVAQAETLLRGFAKEAVAGQTTIEAAAKTTISIMNSLGLTVDDLTRIQDVQFQIVRKGIITYEELANTIGRALPAAARSGQTFETLGGMMAFLTRNGLSAAMAATSAARALESFAHPKTVAKLEDMGIAVRNAKGEFLPLVDVMRKMNDKLKIMTAPDRAKFIQELFTGAGGTIQARRFWDVAFKNFDQFEEMIGFMGNASGVFENAYATMAGSVATKSELLRNKWMLLKEALGKAVLPHLLKLMDFLGMVLDWFNKLPEGTKETISQFILWGSVIGVVVGALVILVGTMAFFVSSIIAGGAALAVILGVIGLVTGALLSMIAAVTLAWEKSENFRGAVEELGKIFKDIWKEIVDTAQEVGKHFDEKLRPSIDKLIKFMEDKGLPAIQRFGQIWMDEVFPKLQEAKRIIEDVAKVVIDHMANAIDNYLLPALQKMNDWWNENQDTIRPLIAIGAQVVKWILIISAVILGSALMGLATVIIGIVLSVLLFINALKGIWEFLQIAFNAVVSFFTEVGTRIMEIANNFKEFWEPIWNSIVGVVKSAIGLIVGIIQLGTALIKEIWKDWLLPLVSFIIDNFMKITDFFIGYFRTFIGIFMVPVRAIVDFWNKHFGGINDSTRSTFNKVSDFISEKIEFVKKLFSGAKDWLYNAGVNVITGFIDGIKAKIDALTRILKEITDKIPEIKGPRAVDLKLLVPAGINIMKGFMAGINSQIPMLTSQLQGITAQIGQVQAPTITVPGVFNRPAQETKTVNQYITVNTQEIDPRVHATELGWELEGRI